MSGRRTFIGVSISKEARQDVAAYTECLRQRFRNIRVGWEKEDKLHLTLKFLGDTCEEQITGMRKALDEIAERHTGFRIHLAGTGVFPNARRPAVLWIGLGEGREELAAIAREIEYRAESNGFEKEKRMYSPHLTIARVREPQKGKALATEHLKNVFECDPFTVSDIVFYESRLSPRGSIYTRISTHVIKGGGWWVGIFEPAYSADSLEPLVKTRGMQHCVDPELAYASDRVHVQEYNWSPGKKV